MDFKKIVIKNLYGFLSYDISLDNSDILIITGPNGYGKTMILNIIYNLMRKNISFFHDLKFDEIKFDINRHQILIKKTGDSVLEVDVFELNNPEAIKNKKFERKSSKNGEYKNELKELTIFLNKFRHTSRIETNFNSRIEKTKNQFSDFLETIISEENVFFIKAQRLLGTEKGKTTIEEQASYLSTLIKNAKIESSEINQQLDSTFPSRLFSKIENNKNFNSELIKEKFYGLQKMREQYIKNGLISSEEVLIDTNLEEFSKEYIKVLELYISDALGKLSPYKELFKKIEMFSELLNHKILSFKSVVISEDQGFYFQSENKTNIELNQLSSGEQNIVIIYFDLIFKTQNSSILLIDEPEISLHVAWQKDFLASIRKIKDLNLFSKLIIATHSPQIINNNWALTFDLYENSNVSII